LAFWSTVEAILSVKAFTLAYLKEYSIGVSQLYYDVIMEK